MKTSASSWASCRYKRKLWRRSKSTCPLKQSHKCSRSKS